MVQEARSSRVVGPLTIPALGKKYGFFLLTIDFCLIKASYSRRKRTVQCACFQAKNETAGRKS
jgi:hypothetical protein